MNLYLNICINESQIGTAIGFMPNVGVPETELTGFLFPISVGIAIDKPLPKLIPLFILTTLIKFSFLLSTTYVVIIYFFLLFVNQMKRFSPLIIYITGLQANIYCPFYTYYFVKNCKRPSDFSDGLSFLFPYLVKSSLQASGFFLSVWSKKLSHCSEEIVTVKSCDI